MYEARSSHLLLGIPFYSSEQISLGGKFVRTANNLGIIAKAERIFARDDRESFLNYLIGHLCALIPEELMKRAVESAIRNTHKGNERLIGKES